MKALYNLQVKVDDGLVTAVTAPLSDVILSAYNNNKISGLKNFVVKTSIIPWYQSFLEYK